MKHLKGGLPLALALPAFLLGILTSERALAQGGKGRGSVPIVMEEATVRGKTVILESRSEDRRTVEGLRVEIWTTQADDPQARRDLIHRTKTDEDGLFSLPLLEVGRYVLTIGAVRLNLTVVAKPQAAAGQAEPKILLVLLPKESI